MKKDDVQDVMEILEAMAEPTRFAALCLVWRDGEHCLCEIIEALGLTQSRASRHMAVLKRAGLVADRRDAQWVRYRRNTRLPARQVKIVEAAMVAAGL